ncbi:MAG: sialidase family protein [Pirellulales bacterium]
MARMHIEDHGLVYDAAAAPSARRVAFFSSLCVLQSGTILCGFEVGSAKHAVDSAVGICRSRDSGATWQLLRHRFTTTLAGVAGSLGGAEMVEIAPGQLQLWATWFDRSEPDRPLFDPATEGILHSKLLLASSSDDGETWSPWQEVATPGLSGCATTGPIVAWPDGTLAYAFESFKEFDDPRPARHAAWLLVSRDGGRTRGEPLLVANDPAGDRLYWDQRLCPTSRPGELVAMFWTHDRAQQRDLNVHLRRAAIDGRGITGESIRATTIPGQIAAPLLLDDQRLLAFVVDRARPGTMKLWQSRDGGLSWPVDDGLLVHEHEERAAVTERGDHIDFAQYWEDMLMWNFGHPAIRRLDSERVLLVYYAGTPDCMSIRWARVHVSD